MTLDEERNVRNEYEGADLEAMSFARRYSAWITGEMRPHLGKRILEVGAGAGSFSRLLLECRPELLVALEPSQRMFSKLQAGVSRANGVETRLINKTLTEAKDLLADARIDSVVYMNVLEHIEDDLTELREAFAVMQAGGTLAVYVPALPWLFGPFDRRVGHFRRYTKDSLTRVALNAGFDILSVKYRDLMGVLPWWVRSKLLRSDELDPAAVRIYDRLIPLVRVIDRITGPPIGKNLLLLAQKPT